MSGVAARLGSDPAPQNKFLVFKLIRYVVHTLAVNVSPEVIKVRNEP